MNDTHRKSWLPLSLAIALVLLTLALFSRTVTFDFVNWDDDVYLYENSRVQSMTPGNIVWFFAHPYYYSYIPLTMLSHMVDFSVWQFNSAGHHATNVILHAINTSWVFVLTLQVLSFLKKGTPGRSLKGLLFSQNEHSVLFAAVFATALYAWHPLRVESVSWISDRKDLLCAFFLLPSMVGYLGYVAAKGEKGARRWYLTSFVLFILACLSKSIAVMLPLVFFSLDYFLLHRKELRVVLREKVPFLVVSIVIVVIAAIITPGHSANDGFALLTPLQRFFLPFYNVIFYLIRTVVPAGLSPVYPQAGEGVMMAAFGFFAIITIFCVWLMKKQKPLPLLAWLCYLMMLAPASGIAPAIIQTTADRYTYLPSVALFLLFAGALEYVWEQLSPVKMNRWAMGFISLAVGGFLAFVAFRQQGIWLTSATLWGKAIETYPSMPLPYNNFGLALQATGQGDKAAESYAKAIQLKPDYVEARLNLGNIMVAKGDLDSATHLFLKAAELNPLQAEIYNNLGVVASARGDAIGALSWLKRSITINPDYADARYNLAMVYSKMGNTAAAMEQLQKAAQLGHRKAEEMVQGEP